MDAVIDGAFDLLEALLPENVELLAKVEKTLKDMFHGTLGNPELDGYVYVKDLVADAKAVVNEFTNNEIINTMFDEIAEIYGDT